MQALSKEAMPQNTSPHPTTKQAKPIRLITNPIKSPIISPLSAKATPDRTLETPHRRIETD
jgi:hypothetical protein